MNILNLLFATIFFTTSNACLTITGEEKGNTGRIDYSKDITLDLKAKEACTELEWAAAYAQLTEISNYDNISSQGKDAANTAKTVIKSFDVLPN